MVLLRSTLHQRCRMMSVARRSLMADRGLSSLLCQAAVLYWTRMRVNYSHCTQCASWDHRSDPLPNNVSTAPKAMASRSLMQQPCSGRK
jgi:hypothetical protein